MSDLEARREARRKARMEREAAAEEGGEEETTSRRSRRKGGDEEDTAPAPEPTPEPEATQEPEPAADPEPAQEQEQEQAPEPSADDPNAEEDAAAAAKLEEEAEAARQAMEEKKKQEDADRRRRQREEEEAEAKEIEDRERAKEDEARRKEEEAARKEKEEAERKVREAEERKRKEAEEAERKRIAEEERKKKMKKGLGGLSPEKKKLLKKLIMEKAMADLRSEAEAKAAEKKKYIADRLPEMPNFDYLDKSDVERKVKELFKLACHLEDEKYDLEIKVRKQDYDINELTIKVNDIKGKFVRPVLKKVSKTERKLAKFEKQPDKTESDFRGQLKSTGHSKYEMSEQEEGHQAEFGKEMLHHADDQE